MDRGVCGRCTDRRSICWPSGWRHVARASFCSHPYIPCSSFAGAPIRRVSKKLYLHSRLVPVASGEPRAGGEPLLVPIAMKEVWKRKEVGSRNLLNKREIDSLLNFFLLSSPVDLHCFPSLVLTGRERRKKLSVARKPLHDTRLRSTCSFMSGTSFIAVGTKRPGSRCDDAPWFPPARRGSGRSGPGCRGPRRVPWASATGFDGTTCSVRSPPPCE